MDGKDETKLWLKFLEAFQPPFQLNIRRYRSGQFWGEVIVNGKQIPLEERTDMLFGMKLPFEGEWDENQGREVCSRTITGHELMRLRLKTL